MTYGGRNYDGLVFQAVLSSKRNRDIFAAGGRYDALIKGFRMPGDQSKVIIHGIGVTFAVNKLISIHQSVELFSATDVLLCAFGRDSMTEKFSILNLLWNSNIRSEIFLDESGSMNIEEITSRCKMKKIPWIVILKDKTARNLGIYI